jgi:hypothetical protein
MTFYAMSYLKFFMINSTETFILKFDVIPKKGRKNFDIRFFLYLRFKCFFFKQKI